MASIGREPGGLRILFVAPDGKRKTLRLGKVSRRQAVKAKGLCLRVQPRAILYEATQHPQGESNKRKKPRGFLMSGRQGDPNAGHFRTIRAWKR